MHARLLHLLSLLLACSYGFTVFAAATPTTPTTSIIERPHGARTVVRAQAAEEQTCLTLEDEAGHTTHLTVPGLLVTAADGRVAWTSAQLAALGGALAPDQLAAALLLEAPGTRLAGFSDGPAPFPRNGKKGDSLRPSCGRCLSGADCSTRRRADCCEDPADDSCTKCKVCKLPGVAGGAILVDE